MNAFAALAVHVLSVTELAMGPYHTRIFDLVLKTLDFLAAIIGSIMWLCYPESLSVGRPENKLQSTANLIIKHFAKISAVN